MMHCTNGLGCWDKGVRALRCATVLGSLELASCMQAQPDFARVHIAKLQSFASIHAVESSPACGTEIASLWTAEKFWK